MQIVTDGIKGNGAATIAALRFDIAPHIARVSNILDQGGYSAPEASVNLPFDTALHDAVERLVARVKTPELRYVFLVGIGGSNLGAKAVYDALYGARDLAMHQQPRLICIDTINEPLLLAVKQIIGSLSSAEEYIVVSISKSGGTTETIMNTEIILNELSGRLGPAPERLIVISDAGSAFIAATKTWGAHTFGIPPNVGGRYSVFSAAGLVPLALCGVDTRTLTAGAEAVCQISGHSDIAQNRAALCAILAFDAYKDGKNIHDMFVFQAELESLGKWWRQLLAESVGKTTRTTPAELVGITPTVSIGSTDLHSVGQLYLGGPNDKLTTFIYTAASQKLAMPEKRIFPNLVPMVSKKTVTEVMGAILSGTKSAFHNRHRSFLSIELESISPYEIGALMQHKMFETIFIGGLMNVNPFDQPDVELYKVVTKELLEKNL